MAQQTAVEWLQYLHKEGILIKKSFEIAKEMEKDMMKHQQKNIIIKNITNDTLRTLAT